MQSRKDKMQEEAFVWGKERLRIQAVRYTQTAQNALPTWPTIIN